DIFARVSILVTSSYTVRIFSIINLIAVNAISLVNECAWRDIKASIPWLNASIPVATVKDRGAETVNSGSTIARCGVITGCLIIIFIFNSVLVTTKASVTSEPVPAVVGIAITGTGFTLMVAPSKYSINASLLFTRTATALAASIQLPPPIATIKSHFSS